ncbi:MAG: glycosyltransferase [Candidatus Margulisiibacteriota bacterium]
MLISACMIVKNEAQMLKKTLPVLVKNLDEVIVVDTGSSDDTKQVAQENGAQVFDFAWINDFSAARNESIKHAAGEWIIWVDADEMLKEEDLLKLKEYLKDAKDKAYSLNIGECVVDTYNVELSYPRVKVFKNGLGSHFERQINEQVYGSEGRVLEGQLLDITVYHWGNKLSDEKMKQKRKRNEAIFGKMLEEKPNDPYANYIMGQSLFGLEEYEKAIECYDRAIEHGSFDRDLFINSLTAKMNALNALNRGKEAFNFALQIRKIDPENIPAHNMLGAILLSDGAQLDLAETILKSVDNFKTDAASAYSKDYNNKMLLGDVYKKKGNNEAALKAYETAQKHYDTDEIKKRIEDLNNGR